MAAQDLYKKRVADLRQPFIEADHTGYIFMHTLASLIGCQLLHRHGTPVDDTYASDIARHEPLIKATLVTLLGYTMSRPNTRDSIVDKYSILDGLAKNNRWRACLQTPQTCYDLVGLLTTVSSSFARREETVNMRRSFDVSVCTILNAWLKPVIPFDIIPKADTLVRNLFGNAWCDIVLGGCAIDAMLTFELVAAIEAARPALREGLLPGPTQVEVCLPALA